MKKFKSIFLTIAGFYVMMISTQISACAAEISAVTTGDGKTYTALAVLAVSIIVVVLMLVLKKKDKDD